MKLRELFLVGALTGAACVPANPQSARSDNKDAVTVGIKLHNETFTLPNGLVVVLHREPTQHSVFVAVHYDVGSKDDPKGRGGLAHLFEHLMFASPKHGGGLGYHALLEDIGADINAYTSHDETVYHDAISPSELPRALWLEADRMAYPASTVDAAALARERDVVKNEWRQRYENQAYGHVLATAYREVFGPDHPYTRPTIGLPAELDAVTPEDVQAFAHAHYRPNHATLVVCGAFDPAIARELVTKYFATIPPGSARPPRTLPTARVTKSRMLTIAADVKAPMVVMAWPAPRPHAPGWEALGLGMELFDARATYRLITSREIADDVEAFVSAGALGSLAVVRVKVKPETSTDTVISALESELGETSRFGSNFTFDRFPDLKTRWVVRHVARLDAMNERAEEILHGLGFHGTPDAVQDDLQRVQRVSLIESAGAVEQLLKDAPRVTLVVKPTKGAPRAGRVTP